MPLEPGVSLELAKYRADTISNLGYELKLAIPEDAREPLAGTVRLRFDLARNDSPLLIDFRQDPDHVLAVRSQKRAVQHRLEKEHIVIPAGVLPRGTNAIEIDFKAPQDSVNRNPEYLFTLFVPDRARSTFPLFDQPDLKARYQLTLQTPPDWQAMSNAPLLGETTVGDTIVGERREFHFAPSDPIPSYLFSFIAGTTPFKNLPSRCFRTSPTVEWNMSGLSSIARHRFFWMILRRRISYFDAHSLSPTRPPTCGLATW